MSIWWLAILVMYGCVYGFATIPGLAWLLLIPFVLQDFWDAGPIRRLREITRT